MLKLSALTLCLLIAVVAGPAWAADPPTRPMRNFDHAKTTARNKVYAGNYVEQYCGCTFLPRGRSGGFLDLSSCGYQRSRAGTEDMEWEHVVPAKAFGHWRACWAGDARCFERDGDRLSNRECCTRIDPEFARIQVDLHNLIPAVEGLNARRGERPYGEVAGDAPQFGSCTFQIDYDTDVAEPPRNIQGDVARISLYMRDTYGVMFTPEQETMFQRWSTDDPVDDWEIERNRRIEAEQGNSNPYVRP
ncbi:endonuclease [Lacibacterium aquatile]|uniref:Endonuclease n=1 Tax=Lacibacterium aquatile TaxID=1168082 RepID=A0ABW5DQL6_9PROT